MSKVLLNGVTYDGVQHIQVPTEDGGLATFFANAEGIPSIDTLDDTLLVADNIGKFYKCGGKLYTIQRTYKPMSADAVAQITSLNGTTFVINANASSLSFAEAIGIPGDYDGTGYVLGQNAGYLRVQYNEDDELDCWFADGGPIGIERGTVCPIERFDYEPINNRPNCVEWVKLNGTFYEYGLGFQQVAAGIPYEADILSVDLVVDENEGNIYANNGELYSLKRVDGILGFYPVIEKPWDIMYINGFDEPPVPGNYDVTNYATVRINLYDY